MGILETVPPLADVIGVQQFFIQDSVLESIGDGNIRAAGVILQNGVYVPQYYVIMSCRTMIRCGNKAALAAQAVLNRTAATSKLNH